MRKYLILFIILFSIGTINVQAAEMATRSCIYQDTVSHSTGDSSWRNYLAVDYIGLGTGIPSLGDIDYFSLYNDNTQKEIFSYEYDSIDHYVNWNTPIAGMESPYLYWTEAIIMQKEDEVVTSEDKALICPSKIYIMEYTVETGFINKKVETTYDLYACGNNYGDYNVDTCQATYDLLFAKRNTVNHDGTAGKLYTLEYYTGTLINNVDVTDNKPSNVQDQYNEATDKMEKYCNEESKDYNAEECNKIKLEQNQLVDQAEDQGYTKEDLEASYVEFKNNLEFGDLNSCNSYLGYIHDSNDPAYYLNFAFQFLKYAAIVILLVLTIIDFAKAVSSNKDDAIKKATQNMIKRLIIAVIIFFLPNLINFIFDLLGIVSTDATCGLGTNV